MCKESSVTLDGKRTHYKPLGTRHGVTDTQGKPIIRHPGKTLRDRLSGQHDNWLQNRAAKAQANKDWAGTSDKARKARAA